MHKTQPSGCLLITVSNICSIQIKTKQFSTKEEALSEMYDQLERRLAMDNTQNIKAEMELLKNGVELSNAAIHEDSAYIYQNCAETWHHWKIAEIR